MDKFQRLLLSQVGLCGDLEGRRQRGGAGGAAQDASHAPTLPSPAAGALFAASESADELADLHVGLAKLLDLAGIADTVRWHDQMPLGFFLELPDRTVHARRKVGAGSPERVAREIKSIVWWSLVLLTGQYSEGCVPYMDHSSKFFKDAATGGDASPLNGTDIDVEAPDSIQLFLSRVTPGLMQPVMQQLRVVEDLTARMLAARPERWRRMIEVQQSQHFS